MTAKESLYLYLLCYDINILRYEKCGRLQSDRI